MSLNVEAFTQAGYEVEELAPELWEVKNFISSADIERIFAFVETLTDEDWIGHYMNHLRDKAEREFGTRDVEALQKEEDGDHLRLG